MTRCAEALATLRAENSCEESRDAALSHTDSCDECRSVALELDPLLLFRQLPRVELAASELPEVLSAVRKMRRRPSYAPDRRTPRVVWLSAALILLCLGVVLQPSLPPAVLDNEDEHQAVMEPVPVSDPIAFEYLPFVEALEPASVYVATQIAEDDLILVVLANVDV